VTRAMLRLPPLELLLLPLLQELELNVLAMLSASMQETSSSMDQPPLPALVIMQVKELLELISLLEL